MAGGPHYDDDDNGDEIDNNVDDIIMILSFDDINIKLWSWWQVVIMIRMAIMRRITMLVITMMMALVMVTVFFIIWQVTEIVSCGSV